MTGAAAMIAEAKKHLGMGEPNKVQEWYRKRNGNAFAGNFAWCDAFVTYCAVQSGNYGVVNHGTDYAYTVAHAQRFKTAGEWHAGTAANINAAKPGDVVFFDWGQTDSIGAIDHVGIIIKALGDGMVQTIEGNTGNTCAIKTRSYRDIAGYGRPKYVTGSPQPAPKPAPAENHTPDADGTIRPGDVGSAVRTLQANLNKLGAKLEVDGEYGPATRKAVDAFKVKHGLTADGIVGDGMRKALAAALAPKPAPKPVPAPQPAPKPVPKPAPVPAPKPVPAPPVGSDALLAAIAGLGKRVSAYQATIDELVSVVVSLAGNSADLDSAALISNIKDAIAEGSK